MEPRGRGRGYGRSRQQGTSASSGARGGPYPTHRPGHSGQRGGPPSQRGPSAPQSQRGPPSGPPSQRGPAGPPQGAWGRPPQPSSSAWPRQQGLPPPPPKGESAAPQSRPPAETGAVPREVVRSEGDEAGNEAGGPGRSGNSVRGRVINRNQIVFTKPPDTTTKQGSSGDKIRLRANYLKLIKNGKWCLYQYRVDMSPEIDRTGTKKFLLRTALREYLQGYLFDGTVMYTPHRLPQDAMELFAKQDNSDEPVKINIRLVGDVVWGDSHYLQLFNIIIRKCLALMGLQQVGRNYFLPSEQVVFSEHKIQLWPGYFTSMRQYEDDILLNVDLSFKFMRTDNVLDMLMECSHGANSRRLFQSKIIGSVVLTYYNNKTYRIDDVDFDSSPKSKFKLADGSETSYIEYYKRKYNIQITSTQQPMLVSRTKPREIRAGMPEIVVLVPELCRLTGLTDKQRENFNLMRQLSSYTRLGVSDRVRRLMEFSHRIHSRPEVVQEIKRWDLGIAKDLVEFEGRVLLPEQVSSAEDKYSAERNADWTKHLRSRPMFTSAKLESLAILTTNRMKGNTLSFLECLRKAAHGMHWKIDVNNVYETRDDGIGSYLEAVERLVREKDPEFIIIVLPNNSADRYSAIKKKCCVDRAVPTQMITSRSLNSKGVMSIATKVAIQLNCKMGGAPWSVHIPLNYLMVVGYDVCRDTANRRKSFSGMVASLDRSLTRYFSFCVEHEGEEELSHNFSAFMVLACKKFREVNGVYPERILIYRDGVGDGQIPYVHEHEVTRIKDKLNEIYPPGKLRMAFIIVSKKINARIFHGQDNPPPGTVVDDVITLPERYDFYLVSQCVRQGTVSPTSYNIIYDTMGLPADKLQILSYKLTHMYYNWSGTVRVPAPCQYAHKLAFMVSQNLHRPAHPDLENVLYYL